MSRLRLLDPSLCEQDLMKAMLKAVLFAATFAGAFAAHQWWKTQSELNGETLDFKLESAEDLMVNLQENVTDLASLAATDNSDDSADTSQVNDLVARADAILTAIREKAGGSDPELQPRARVAHLSAYFLAYLEQPESFREPLIELCGGLEQDYPGSPYAFQASAFHFAAQHDLTARFSESGRAALQEQASSYEYAGYGAALYSFVSKQLHCNGQEKCAEEVLTAGLERYRGQPGWHDLFQQQFTQGYLQSPGPAANDAGSN
jgi:hypothetical protein